MAKSADVTMTGGEKRLYKGIMADVAECALKKVAFPEDGLRKLIERRPELQDGIARLIAELSVSDQYADEEVPSDCTYPEEYKGPKPIADQIKALAEIFDLDPSYALEFAKNLPALPDGAEGWFAIPSFASLAKKHFPEVTDPAQKYCQAVQLVHAKIAASRFFHDYFHDYLYV